KCYSVMALFPSPASSVTHIVSATVFVQFTLHPDHQRSQIEGSSRLMGTFAWAPLALALALALALVLVGLSVVLYAKLSAGYPRKTRLVQVDLERGGGKELFVMVH